MSAKTFRLTLLALLTLLSFTAEPALAQRGRGFRSSPRISAPRSPRLNTPSTSVFSRRGPLPPNSFRRYRSYRSPNPFANLFPWLFLWSVTSNRGQAQEDAGQNSEVQGGEAQTGGTADRVVGLNLGAVFIVIVGVILIFGAVMFYVGIRQSGP